MKTRYRGRQDYVPLWHEMQHFTDTRDKNTPDEIWFCEHPPVFTLGLNAAKEHLLAPGDIPVVQIDRGGQVTFHGPFEDNEHANQWIAYCARTQQTHIFDLEDN